MERTSMPANELEGLIRDRLPGAVRRHLRDVQIYQIDRDNNKPNWIGMPIWETDPSDDDKRKFLATMHRLRRKYDLLATDRGQLRVATALRNNQSVTELAQKSGQMALPPGAN